MRHAVEFDGQEICNEGRCLGVVTDSNLENSFWSLEFLQEEIQEEIYKRIIPVYYDYYQQ